MGVLGDKINEAFRDFNTASIPASGIYKPLKSVIRELGPLLDYFAGLAASGVKPVIAARLATTANIALTGEQTIDGQLTSADGIVVWKQTDAKENGYWLSAAGAWTRVAEFNTGEELLGARFFINEGTANVGKTLGVQNTTVPTVGVDNIVIDIVDSENVSIPGALDAIRGEGNSIATASSIDLDAATGDLFMFTGTTAVDTATLTAGRERIGVATSAFTINVSSTLIGDNGGLPVPVQPGDAVVFKGMSGGIIRFWRWRETPPLQEHADDIVIFSVTDVLRRSGFSVSRSPYGGFMLQAADGYMLSMVEMENDPIVAFAVKDKYKRAVFWVGHDGGIHTNSGVTYPGGGSGGGAFDAGEIAAYNSEALASSALVKANGNPSLQKFLAGVAHVALYGQSLSVDALGHWLRRSAQIYDAKMLGNSIHSSNAASSSFNPFGGSAVLNDYTPTVLNAAGNALIATSADVAAAGGWMAALYGSDSATGFADMAKFLWLQRNSLASDATRKFVLTNTGRGGKLVSELAQGTTFYDRTVNGANKIKAADATAYMIALLWTQGEANVGAGTTFQDYYDEVRALFDDIDVDIGTDEYAQVRRPLKLIHQTSSKWVEDTTNQAVQMAQLALAEDFPDIAVVGPAYQYPNKTEADGHLDANGYLWKGCQEAKVFDRMVFGGEGWQPLKIIKAVQRGNEILVIYNVPAPPLQFKAILAGYTLTTYSTKGFKVTDGVGTIGITAVDIVADAVIRLTLGSLPTGTATVWYASQTTAGQGNVFDSDPTQCIFNYTYLPADGDDAAVNVASLVDQPFSLNNAACVQIIDAVTG